MSELETSSESPTDDAGLPFSFDAWAALSARLSKLTQDERFDILDQHEVTSEDWQRCERHYTLALADEIGEGHMDRARIYAAQCAAEMARRGSAGDVPPVVAPPAEKVDANEPAPAPETAVPTFLQQRDVAIVTVGPVQLPPENLATTAAAFELPTALRAKAADSLPFRAGAAPSIATSPAEPKPPHARSPVVGGATIGADDQQADPHTTLPFARAAGGPSPVIYPRMPLKTHASFCAELALFPEKTAEILQKYKVSGDAARAALEQEWRGRLDAHPDTKAEWDTAFATYRDWLRQQRR